MVVGTARTGRVPGPASEGRCPGCVRQFWLLILTAKALHADKEMPVADVCRTLSVIHYTGSHGLGFHACNRIVETRDAGLSPAALSF